jgi:hypothetical protein
MALPDPPSKPRLQVRVYNLANVSTGTLNRALELANSVFAKAAVETCWELGSPEANEAHFTDMSGSAPGQHLKVDDRRYLVL